MYVEDLKRGTNPVKGGRPKDIFEMGSKNIDGQLQDEISSLLQGTIFLIKGMPFESANKKIQR